MSHTRTTTIQTQFLPSLSDQLVHDTFTKRKAHHVNSPPTAFVNPWPSFAENHGLVDVLSWRFSRSRPPFVPVPANREGLVGVRQPDLELLRGQSDAGKCMRVTWLGHAGFLVQTSWTSRSSTPSSNTVSDQTSKEVRGINILLHPLFSERTSPVSFAGPKRYTPVPISLSDLADAVDVDLVLLSHNHYDHADAATLKYFYDRRKGSIKFLVALGNSRWLKQVLGLAAGEEQHRIIEMDWWDCIQVELQNEAESNAVGSETESKDGSGFGSRVKIICTPSQHTSARSPFDKNRDLWCSFVIEEMSPESKDPMNKVEAKKEPVLAPSSTSPEDTNVARSPTNPSTTNDFSTKYEPRRIFFAGDTGYMSVPSDPEALSSTDELTPCPAFRDIAHIFQPLHLALLPVSPCEPRSFVSGVHANPADAIAIHRDTGSQRSIAMHWGTVRGGLSAAYEEVTLARREWQAEAEKAGMKFGWGGTTGGEKDGDWEIGGIDVGETFVL